VAGVGELAVRAVAQVLGDKKFDGIILMPLAPALTSPDFCESEEHDCIDKKMSKLARAQPADVHLSSSVGGEIIEVSASMVRSKHGDPRAD
jgi:hypothetical protein